jgi:hypothetical protein
MTIKQQQHVSDAHISSIRTATGDVCLAETQRTRFGVSRLQKKIGSHKQVWRSCHPTLDPTLQTAQILSHWRSEPAALCMHVSSQEMIAQHQSSHGPPAGFAGTTTGSLSSLWPADGAEANAPLAETVPWLALIAPVVRKGDTCALGREGKVVVTTTGTGGPEGGRSGQYRWAGVVQMPAINVCRSDA